VTSLILCQALLNVFAVLGLAPLTGVPLPFVSYGSSSLVVMLAAMGLLLNVAAGGTAHVRDLTAPRRRARDARGREPARLSRDWNAEEDRDRRRRNRGARGARARGGGRAAGTGS
jgi:cell division protein FtsW